MTDLVIAGGGVSGMASAIMSSSLGSKVTLLEESETVGLPKDLSHLLLRDEFREVYIKPTNPEELKARFGIATRLKERVVSADTRKRVVTTSDHNGRVNLSVGLSRKRSNAVSAYVITILTLYSRCFVYTSLSFRFLTDIIWLIAVGL